MSIFWITTIAGFALSFAGKLLADAYLDDRVAIIGDAVGLQFSLNPGIAFGLRLPAGWQEVFIIIALGFVCWLGITSASSRWSRIGYGLILGGGAANIADRLFDGFVTDFFQVGAFPIFNVADSCITVGVGFLLAETIILSQNAHHKSV